MRTPLCKLIYFLSWKCMWCVPEKIYLCTTTFLFSEHEERFHFPASLFVGFEPYNWVLANGNMRGSEMMCRFCLESDKNSHNGVSIFLSSFFEVWRKEVWNGGNTRWKNGSNWDPYETEKSHQWEHQTVKWEKQTNKQTRLKVNLLRFQDWFTVVESIWLWLIYYKMTFEKHFSFENMLIFGDVEENMEQGFSIWGARNMNIYVYICIHKMFVYI